MSVLRPIAPLLTIRGLSPVLCAALIAACASTPRAPTPDATEETRAATTPVPAPATPAPADAPPTSATEALAKFRAPFDTCYAHARQGNAELRRTSVEVTFGVDDSGKPSTVDLVYRRRMDDATKECMRNAAFAVQFPPSLRGKQTGTIELAAPPQ